MKKLYLPSLRGGIGKWTYYSTVMKIKDIVDNNRIITVAESSDLYTKNINEILQREINTKRINKISKYLLENDERFFNSLTVAIHKGDPQWYDIDVDSYFQIENRKITDETIQFIENKFGILELSGNEQIFALDGQHRLIGIRDAYKKNKKLGDEEISLIIVVHNNDNKVKTRRLFTVLNKYAEKPKGAELIILDEDDCRAINTRRLVEDHPILSKQNSISSSKSGNIPNNDISSFTTLVTVNKINNILYKKRPNYYTKRPAVDELNSLYDISVKYWDFLFDTFPEIVDFIDGRRNIHLNGLFDRNSETGGSLLLRPIGQEIIAKIYYEFLKKREIETLKSKIRKIDFNLSGKLLKYLFWHNGKMQPKNNELKINIFKYVLGLNMDEINFHKEMEKLYESFGDSYSKIDKIR